MLPGTRSARLAAWASGWLAGRAAMDDVVARVLGDDELHLVDGLPGEAGPVPLERLLLRLRADGTTALRLALPVPGDVTGLPDPPDFRRAAAAAGEAVLTVDGPPLGLLPVVEEHGSVVDGVVRTTRWSAHPVEPYAGPPVTPPLAEAEYGLRQAVREAAEELAALDVARLPPELAAPLAGLRQQRRDARWEGVLVPPGHPDRALGLLALAESLTGLLDLAWQDEGAVVNAWEANARADALRRLGHAVRLARLAAYTARP